LLINASIERRIASAHPTLLSDAILSTAPVISLTVASNPTAQCDTRSARAPAEALRIGFGTGAVGWDNHIYGALLVVFIIFLPKGMLGSLLDRARRLHRVEARPTLRSRPWCRRDVGATHG
jgi:hypothetical protein